MGRSVRSHAEKANSTYMRNQIREYEDQKLAENLKNLEKAQALWKASHPQPLHPESVTKPTVVVEMEDAEPQTKTTNTTTKKSNKKTQTTQTTTTTPSTTTSTTEKSKSTSDKMTIDKPKSAIQKKKGGKHVRKARSKSIVSRKTFNRR